jgi:hypothetical protein
MTSDELRNRLTKLFLPGGRLHGRYQPPEGDEIETTVPGAAWKTLVWPAGSASPHVMRVYAVTNGNTFLERFWRNEARALHRLSGRRHPNLPRLRAGALMSELGIGFVTLEDPGLILDADHPRMTSLRSDPLLALRTFLDLAEALSLLHGEGLAHRGLTPSCLAAPGGEAPGPVVLDGFQFSAFLASWLRRASADHDAGGRALLPADAASVACLAPERLGSLLGGAMRHLETFAADVFGLGMIVAFWLGGNPPADEASQVTADGRYHEEAHIRLIRSTHERLRLAKLPTPLRRLLEEMTSPAASNRIPSGSEVLDSLGRILPSVSEEIEVAKGSAPSKPMHVFFMKETVERIYKDGLGRSSPEQPDEAEYRDFIGRDLAAGLLVWSPRGFEPWTDRAPDSARRATVVLLGQRYAYFCEYFNAARPDEEHRILLVKYPTTASRVAELRHQARRKPCPKIEAAYYREASGGRIRPIPSGTPSWKTLVDDVRFEQDQDAGSVIAATAEWLVRYQEAALAVREFSFERTQLEGDPGARPIVLRSTGRGVPYDRSREQAAFPELFHLEGLVRPMGEWYESLVEEAFEDGDQLEFLVRTETGDDVPIRLIFEERLDPNTVRFRSDPGEVLVPVRGRVRPDDEASRSIVSRQRRAVAELSRSYELLKQLREPRGLQLGDPDVLQKTALELEKVSPDAAGLVRRILDEEPLFIVQGPPGTGKTFVASHVVREVLLSDPYARILVSSQSNAATDNILETVVKRLSSGGGGTDDFGPLVLRHASAESEARVSEEARECLLPAQVLAARRRIIAKARGADGHLKRIQREWVDAAQATRLDPDLHVRLQRASNAVFATCAGAGADVEALRGGSGFDWVIVEEAARAWLSEVAVPLVQGDRWLLIGDQRQLPAFAREEVERLLRRDIQDKVTAEATGRLLSESMLPYLTYFKHAMEVDVAPSDWTLPRTRIDEQRRMHPDIGTLISRGFYVGALQTHGSAARPHGLQRPAFLRQSAFVWIDTGVYGTAAYDHGRENLLEVKLLKYLLREIGDFPVYDAKIPSVLVLSPYRKQLKLLRERIQLLPGAAFQTVDAVQGREAEVVLVSLVKSNSADSLSKAIGFLDRPERVNVMFSRARRLLVIVGNLGHFERFGETHWGEVARYTRSDARFVVDPSQPPLSFVPQGAQQ